MYIYEKLIAYIYWLKHLSFGAVNGGGIGGV
jgi:hypothetical protein